MSQEARKKRVGRWVVVRREDGRQLRVLFVDKQKAQDHANYVTTITGFDYLVMSFIGDAHEIKP
jgi:hypothetical protein